MIPILFDSSETTFTSNGLGRLSDVISCTVTEERNGMYELEMEYFIDGIHYGDLEVGRFIYALVSNGTKQIFQIYDITRPLNGRVKVYAEHISYRMRMIPVLPFTAIGASATLQALKNNAVEDCPFTFWTDITATDQYTLPHPDEMRGKLQGDRWSICQEFGGELEFDNYNVKLWQSRGSRKNFTLRYGVDIVDMTQEENIQNTYTGIVPYWYGFVGEIEEDLYLPEIVLYSDNVGNFPTHRTITVDFTEDFPEKPTVEELRARGNRYLRENEIGIPNVNIQINPVVLYQSSENSDAARAMERIYLCDTIKVVFEKLHVSTEAQITKTVWDVLLERYETFGIGAIHRSLAVTITDQGQEISNIRNNDIPARIENALLNVARVKAYNSAATRLLEIMGSHMDIRQLDGSTWRQRVGASIESSKGKLQLSSGEVDADGNVTGSSNRTILTSNSLEFVKNRNDVSKLTLDSSGNLTTQGEIKASHGTASTRAGVTATRTDTGASISMIVGTGGNNHGLYSDSMGEWLIQADGTDIICNGKHAPTRLDSAMMYTGTATYTDGAKYSFLVMVGEAVTNGGRLTLTIPTAYVTTTTANWIFTDGTENYIFSLTKSGDDIIAAFVSRTSTGRIMRAYGVK